MMHFEKKVSNFIARGALLHAGAPVVVAISGGADSVALLAVLTALGHECIAAHCNFHLRGDESDRDMAHVQAICASLGVSLHIKHFDVEAQMQATGQSVEMACRDLRYAWFRSLVAETKAQAIAVGHHREDQVETFMLNLTRGTGLAGLTGMAALSTTSDNVAESATLSNNGTENALSVNVVRPMLECSRAEIEQYVHNKGLSFIVDSTNAQNDYKRNRLRNVVIPTLEQNFEGATNAILATMSHLADNHAFYTYAVQALGKQFIVSENAVNINAMRQALPAQVARMLLFEMLRPLHFNITHVDNILAASASAKFKSTTHHAELSRGVLTTVINTDVDNSQDTHPVTLDSDICEPIDIAVSLHSIDQFSPERDNNVIYLDASVLEGNPTFELRHWRRGDLLQPFGMKGTKLVSDIFADLKLSAQQKRETWILTRNGEILWIVGIRASRHFAVGKNSYLRLAKK